MATETQIKSPDPNILSKRGNPLPWWGWLLILILVVGIAVGIYYAIESTKKYEITPTPFLPTYTNMTTSMKPT